MTRVGIVGYGMVGKALGTVFKQKNIQYFWKDIDEGTPLETMVRECQFVFVTVPTPTNFEAGKQDQSIVKAVVKELAELVKDTVIVIKSTVVPGTTRMFQQLYPNVQIVFNPEFLTEANAAQDFLNQDRIVIGGDKEAGKLLEKWYREYWPDTPIFRTSDATEAEMAKYVSNAFLATKVIYANEIKNICDVMKIDYSFVKDALIADKRVGKTHLDVTKEGGFGGSCFPKDIVALISLANSINADARLLETVWEKNLKVRKIHEWL